MAIQMGPVLRRKRLGMISYRRLKRLLHPVFAFLAGVTDPQRLYLRRLLVSLFTWLRKVENTMTADGVMDNIRNLFEQSGMTLNELGEGLGYNGPTAKKRAWFLLYRTSNPRISTVLAVAQSLGVKISDLVK